MFHRGCVAGLALAAILAGCAGEDDPMGLDVPGTPTGVTVIVSGTSLQVSWTGVTGATAYDVQRAEASGSAAFADLATDQSGTTYTDDTPVAGTTYLYRIRAKNGRGASAPSEPAAGEVPPNIQMLSGTITSDVTLDASQIYIITGVVSVADGASLTIPAGTLLRGSVSVQPSALMVRKGGRIFSNGTAAAPVVFTSDAPVGQRSRGDWGGVVINGRSICNFLTQANPVSECVGEGASGPYGENPPVLDDDSGVMTYTRIEFAGHEVSFGNELNALTLNAVGSGTELHHIQTHYGSDDGFEWFGGTVDLKYALATGISDDSFDYSTGWQGRGQFWISQHDPNDADTGWEVDGNENDFAAQPYTAPTIYNVTLVGKGVGGTGGTAGESTTGMLLRRGTSGDVFNAIVIGFGTAGIDIDNPETTAQGLTLNNSIIGLNAVDVSADSDGVDDVAFVGGFGTNEVGVDPLLADPFNRAVPDFRPGVGSPALAGYAAPPSDGFFEAVDFIGGADPDEATPWYTGWTTTATS